MRRALLLVVLAACSQPFTPIEPVIEPDVRVEDAGADHDAHDGGAGCETIGRTGGTDTCLLFAYCGHRRLELDCSTRFTCVCSEAEIDGVPKTTQIAAQPAFCESPSPDLRPAFEAARRACRW